MCLKETSFLSTSTEREAEQHILLHYVCIHEKCSCISSPVKDTIPRKMKKSRAKSSTFRTDVPSSQHKDVACQKAGCRVHAKAECHPKLRQDVAGRLVTQKKTASLLAVSAPGCRQAASDRLAQRRSIQKSGRRDSNSRQPAWKAGVRTITACLAQTAFTG
jgi:hypothetical protein